LKEPGRKIQLTPYDDLFQTTDPNKSEPAGTIELVRLDQLHPFPDHPFKLYSEDRIRSCLNYLTLTEFRQHVA